MPSRRGWIGRLVDGVKRIVIGVRPLEEPVYNPPPPSEPPREPPRPPDNPPPGEGDYEEVRLRNEYYDVTGTYTGYLDWYDSFQFLQIDIDNFRDREYFWDLYLRSFYLLADEPGSIERGGNNNPGRFYRESGLSPSSINWHEWRELMGDRLNTP